jgi:hypothetical protein
MSNRRVPVRNVVSEALRQERQRQQETADRPKVRHAFDGEPYREEETVTDFSELDLHRTWRKRMRTQNDFILCVTASSTTEISGTGKTTLAIQLARHFDDSPTPFDAAEQATLSSEEVSQDLLPEIEPRSSIIFDEAQGTAQSDGADSRRAMSDEVVKMSRAAAAYRYRQPTLIIVTQSTQWLDSRLMDLIDRIVLIQETNHEEGWARAVVFDHWFEDLSDSRKDYYPAREELYWGPLPDDDEDYQTLHAMKEESGKPDEGEEEDEGVVLSEVKEELKVEERISDILGWHGGHYKWTISKEKLRDHYPITVRQAKRLKDMIVEDPEIDIQEIGDEERGRPS